MEQDERHRSHRNAESEEQEGAAKILRDEVVDGSNDDEDQPKGGRKFHTRSVARPEKSDLDQYKGDEPGNPAPSARPPPPRAESGGGTLLVLAADHHATRRGWTRRMVRCTASHSA